MSNTTARGYGHTHQAERKRLIPIVRNEGAMCCAKICVHPTRWMPPGTEPWQWDLGHTEDRTAYTGPEHRRCNRADGGRRRGRPGQRRRWIL